MVNISAGNRLYLYHLLSRELGVGRQVLLARAEEVLAADGIVPEDLGCADMRQLCEQLGEFVKLTAFRKGHVYATVLAYEEYDRALARLAGTTDSKAASSGKPWKRRKGAKTLKPVKPRHVERVVSTEPEVVVEAEPEPAVEPEPTVEPMPAVEVEPTAEVEPAAVAEPEPAPEPAPVAAAEPEPEPAPEPEPVAAPEPAPAPTPKSGSISLTITYTPKQKPTENAGVPQVQDDLPQDFHADVRCPNEQLSVLYQVLPHDVDPLATLEEDFRVARSTGTTQGTRSTVSFSLRYLQADGSTPVRVTLHRSARPVMGKRWTLAEVDAGSPEDVGIEGLSAPEHGAWLAFLQASGGREHPDPERALAQTIVLGPWEDVLARLSSLAAPEDWGPENRVLHDYLTMTFAHVQAEGALAIRPDGSAASFDTGLLDAAGHPIYAQLTPHPSDIPWALTGFSTAGSAPLARYAIPAALGSLDPALPAPPFSAADAVARNPRMATAAYDPISNEVRLLVPHDGAALALGLGPGGYVAVATLGLADAYSCARVLGAEQPSWLAAGLKA